MRAKVVRIREGNADDASALATLHRQTVLRAYAHIFPPDAPEPELGSLIQEWTDRLGNGRQSATCFVAHVAAETVGVAVAQRDPRRPLCGHLSRMYVDPNHWGRGVGTSLYMAAIARLREKGFAIATLWVLEANLRARRWYERLGWQPNGERITTYAPAGIDDLGYELIL